MKSHYLAKPLLYTLGEMIVGFLIYFFLSSNGFIKPFSIDSTVLFTNSATALPILLAAITFLYERLYNKAAEFLNDANTIYSSNGGTTNEKITNLNVVKTSLNDLNPVIGGIISSLIVLFVSVIISGFDCFARNNYGLSVAIVAFVVFIINITYVMFMILRPVYTKVKITGDKISDYIQKLQPNKS